MMLQALVDYYDRKAADPASTLAPPGFEYKEIPFVLIIDTDGRWVQLSKRWTGAGKKKVTKAELVPQAVKRASGVAANLLWDTSEYTLGIDVRGNPERVVKQHAAFIERLHEVFGEQPQDEGVAAVLRFLTGQREEVMQRLVEDPDWAVMLPANPLLSFQLVGDRHLVCQRPAVIRQVRAAMAGTADGFCLVRGEPDQIARIHPAIQGVWGAQTAGGNVVSFNCPAFTSFGKEQGSNAPVGEQAAFAYTTALNHLLAKGSSQRVQVGDASTVFWAAEESGAVVEDLFDATVKGLDIDDDSPDAGTEAVRSAYRSVLHGRPVTADDGQRFYVLGLAPNAARLSVRFWHVARISELSAAFRRYFQDIDIVRPNYVEGVPLSLFRMLTATVLQGKADNIPPSLGGDVLRAILTESPYPHSLLQGALRRIRAEREIGWIRAALLKACLIRNWNQEVTVSLNAASTDPGYLLGRLFAVLERVQERAQGNLNATIRDRYYGAFSTTPLTVLPLLMKLKNHHLAKLENKGEAVNLEKLLASIFAGFTDGAVPARLSLPQQAQFAVGYYHQRQAFFTRAAGDADTAAATEATQ